MSKVLELEKEMLDKLEENLKNAKGWNNYLEGVAKTDVNILTKYSARNIMLIFNQYKNAQKLRTFYGWASENKKINKGAKAINILSPVPFCKLHKNVKDCPKDCAEQKVLFKGMPLFDIKQTDAPLEEVYENARGWENDEELIALLRKWMGYDFQITDKYADGEESGYTDQSEINISKNLAPEAYRMTLLHEFSHMYFYRKMIDKDHHDRKNDLFMRAKKEIKTQALAIILANHLEIGGIDMAENYGYIKTWAVHLDGVKISTLVKEAINAYKKIITENKD